MKQLVVATLALFLQGGAVQAQSLLAEYNTTGSINFPVGASYSFINLMLGYTLRYPFDPPVEVCIGCNFAFSIDTVAPGATFQFDSSNTNDFAVFSNRLTNNTDDQLWWTWAGRNSAEGPLETFAGYGNPDTLIFPTAQTWEVDYVRLVVNGFAPGVNDGATSYSADLSWQVWGSGIASGIFPSSSPSTVSPIPEPDIYVTLLAGLAILRLQNELRRRKQRN
jgi:hypothetical protein